MARKASKYRGAPPRRMRDPFGIVPAPMRCPVCEAFDWLVNLHTEEAECLVCGSVFSKDYFHR